MKTSLAIKIGRLRLKNPVMVASGTFGEEYAELVDIRKLGAIVAKTVTLKPRLGNPAPRIAETPSGMLNSIGLENKGIDDFLANKLPRLNRFGVPVIASIAGDNASQFAELARRLSDDKAVAAIELNLSCPNLPRTTPRLRSGQANHPSTSLGAGERPLDFARGRRTTLIAQDPEITHDVIKAVRKATPLTLIAKLSPNVTDIGQIAKAAEAAGADSILIANTFLAMAVDIKTRRPKLGNITGGLSGPAIKPIVLRMVWETYKKVRIPIIGGGGIMSAEDAIEFILCGAAAVQIGTANFVNPKAPVEIVAGIKAYLARNKGDRLLFSLPAPKSSLSP
jgi:dihydroorotate dehydrogenase (NAD+) catalytic subunit